MEDLQLVGFRFNLVLFFKILQMHHNVLFELFFDFFECRYLGL